MKRIEDFTEPVSYKTPLNDLRKSDLDHYEQAASAVMEWHSGIPEAINFYYDYHQMNLWQKIKQAFK